MSKKLAQLPMVIFLIFLIFLPNNIFAVGTKIWNEKEDFVLGVKTDTNIDEFEGDITLDYENEAENYINTTSTDFNKGGNDPSEINITQILDEDGGEVIIDNKYRYTSETNPRILSSYVDNVYLGEESGLLYVDTQKGVSVIDNKQTLDSNDDELVAEYNTLSSPALEGEYMSHSWMDEETGLLYVGNEGAINSEEKGGLTVIDTKKTTTQSDDEVLITYNQNSTPAISMDADQGTGASFSFMDPTTNYLYIGSGYSASNTVGGLSAVDTKGTKDVSDDVLVTAYTKSGSVARLLEEDIEACEMDYDSGIIYCIGNDLVGIAAIDTKKTNDPSDDTSFAYHRNTTRNGVYDTTNGAFTQLSATPKLPTLNHQYDLDYDNENKIIYLNNGSNIIAIYTQGTADFGDDKSYIYKNTGLYETTNDASGVQLSSEIFFPVENSYIYNLSIDENNDRIYVTGYYSGLTVIDTKGTADPIDDTLDNALEDYDMEELGANAVAVDDENNIFYVGANSGLYFFSPDKNYSLEGNYLSQSFKILDLPSAQINWKQEVASGQTVSMKYRTEGEEVWRNDFDDGLTNEFVGDYYDYGHTFSNAEESDGTIKISNPSPNVSGDDQWVDFWIDTGQADDYFPIQYRMTARVRVNSSTRIKGYYDDYIYTDNWGDSRIFWNNNEWQIVSVPISNESFSKIGFDINWQKDTWDNANDSFEIDWVKINAVGEWSETCTEYTSCAIDPVDLAGKDYLQYGIKLSTTDDSTTPKVTSVTFSDGYKTAGTYESENTEFSQTANIFSFNSDTSIPEGTNIEFQYSFDNGLTWSAMEANNQFPAETKANSFKWKAIFSTTNKAKTPTIHNASFSSDQANLEKIKQNNFSLNSDNDEKISFKGTNYLAEKKTKLEGINEFAKSGKVTLYKVNGSGSKDKVNTSSVDENGSWRINLPKGKDGSINYYYLRFTDSVGNESDVTKKFKIKVDSKKPNFAKTSLTSVSRRRTINFKALDEESEIDYYKIKILDKNGHILRGWKKQKIDYYNIPMAIRDEAKKVMVKAYDKAGNYAEINFNIF